MKEGHEFFIENLIDFRGDMDRAKRAIQQCVAVCIASDQIHREARLLRIYISEVLVRARNLAPWERDSARGGGFYRPLTTRKLVSKN